MTSARTVVSCVRTSSSSARKLAASARTAASSDVRAAAAATRGTWLAWWPDSRLLSAKIRRRILASARRWRRRLSKAGERGATTAAGAVEAMVGRPQGRDRLASQLRHATLA